jgi:catechol 2,3-dioxygenase-like lactoylglutathione lyase family enzyme|tara:strand:+ start:14890 stop:15321 length:432 start_codon:yes stop_codon:yes gene_type:complete
MLNIRHTGIVVSDAERSIDFYTNLLGFEIKKDMMESGDYIDNFSDLSNARVRTIKMTLKNGDMVELLWYETHPDQPDMNRPITKIGCSHFAMTVENLDKTYNRLVIAGVHFNSPPQLSPDGFAKVTFCKDPDGSLIELVEELR